MKNLIEEKWLSFFDAALKGKNVGVVQKVETRRAFYCGAVAMFSIMNEISDECGNDTAKAARKVGEVYYAMQSYFMNMSPAEYNEV
jgi:hypothetical protein